MNLPVWNLPGGNVPISDAAARLGGIMATTGEYFLKGEHLVRRASTGEHVQLELVSPDEFVSLIERFVQPQRNGSPGTCSPTNARLVLAASAFTQQMPSIVAVSNCPVLVEVDGELQTIVGYDPAARI